MKIIYINTFLSTLIVFLFIGCGTTPETNNNRFQKVLATNTTGIRVILFKIAQLN